MARKLNSWLDGYMEYTENTEPPYLYRVWVGLSAIASVLQRKCSLKMGMVETFPNLFIALVGPSGAGKSRSMQVARELLREVGVKMSAQRITNEALIRDMKMSLSDPIDSSGSIFSHSSFTVHASELAVFLGDHNTQMLSDLCDLYDCDTKWEYKTKDPTKADEIIKPYLNIIGGITPALLQSRLPAEAIGGGLTSRMVCIYEEKHNKLVPMPSLSDREKRLKEHLIDDLFAMNAMSGHFKLDPGFVQSWIEWYIDARENPPFDSPQLEGYCSRRPLHVLKMVMVLSASTREDMIVTQGHLHRAIKILKMTERNMDKTFRGVGESKLGKVITDLMRYIAKEGTTSIERIHKKFYSDASQYEIDGMMRQIQTMKYCKWYLDTGEIVYTKEEVKDGELNGGDLVLGDSIAEPGDNSTRSVGSEGVQEEGS